MYNLFKFFVLGIFIIVFILTIMRLWLEELKRKNSEEQDRYKKIIFSLKRDKENQLVLFSKFKKKLIILPEKSKYVLLKKKENLFMLSVAFIFPNGEKTSYFLINRANLKILDSVGGIHQKE